jgi:hypothetical protein
METPFSETLIPKYIMNIIILLLMAVITCLFTIPGDKPGMMKYMIWPWEREWASSSRFQEDEFCSLGADFTDW